MRSICAPLRPASTRARIRGSSVSAFILSTMRAFSPRAAAAATRPISSSMRFCRWNGAMTSFCSLGMVLWLDRWRNTASISAVISSSQVSWLMSV
ncbi:hypothetical protein D3C77_696860 [compost metagenome]